MNSNTNSNWELPTKIIQALIQKQIFSRVLNAEQTFKPQVWRSIANSGRFASAVDCFWCFSLPHVQT